MLEIKDIKDRLKFSALFDYVNKKYHHRVIVNQKKFIIDIDIENSSASISLPTSNDSSTAEIAQAFDDFLSNLEYGIYLAGGEHRDLTLTGNIKINKDCSHDIIENLMR